jgi:UDP-glucuronate 4-epimerase
MPKTIFVTGAAGFIGHSVSESLLARGLKVVGIDNLNSYYDPGLKEARIARLSSPEKRSRFVLYRCNLQDPSAVAHLFKSHLPDGVIHLAAQAGVRHSLSHPQAYVDSNITGFLNILECLRSRPVHLVYASSSSVYGGNPDLPFSEDQRVERPVSLHAATKMANELMAYAYSHLFGIPATGLRFFTVYGPWGRPDMAYFKFVKAILAGQVIQLHDHGAMQRDFTYIDDIAEGVLQAFDHPPLPEPAAGDFAFDMKPAHRVLNVGNGRAEKLTDLIAVIEEALGIKARCEFLPMQPGDVPATCADTKALQDLTGFAPSTPLRQGVQAFVRWYRQYYRV